MKAAIYCRLSEEDRDKRFENDDSISIQNQKSMLLQYAIAQGWEIFQIYSDDDYTGSDRNRPEFKRLLADAEARKFDIVLCKTQSRFTRELELVEKYLHGLFPLWGIRFVSIVDNADTDNKGNKKSRQINGLVNEWYLEDMSENIRSVLDNRRENGFHIGAFAPYGYRKDPERKGHLLIDEDAAGIVREVFAMFVQGMGKTAIARVLNDRGVPNPTEYKRLHGERYQQPKQKNSTLWKYFAIADMLGNEVYIGNLVQGKYGSVSYKTKQCRPRPKKQWIRVEGTHDAIIDRELWNRVQSLLRERTKPFSGGEIGLFARKVRCANCGYIMRSSKSHGRHYLKCSNRHVSEEACNGAFISVDLLEQIVCGELRRLSETYLDRDQLERGVELHDTVHIRQERLAQNAAAYQKKLEEHKHVLQELYLDKVRGILPEADFLTLSKGFSVERDRLEALLQETQGQLDELQARALAGESRKKLIERYTGVEHLTREMVEALIDYIVVGKRGRGEKAPPVEIHWNF